MAATIAEFLGQSVIAAALVAVAVYLGRNLVEARLTRSIQYEFDQKFAKLKAQLEADSARLESVRSTALSALLSQRSALSAKRIEAAQTLWNGVIECRKGAAVAMCVELINIDKLIPELNKSNVKAFLAALGSGEVMTPEYLTKLQSFSAQRPFVSPAAWALYAVHSTVIVLHITKLKMLQLGEDPKQFVTGTWVSLVAKVLPPDETTKIGTNQEHGLQWALGRIEEMLVEEIRRSLGESTAGKDSLIDAEAIIRQAESIGFSTASALGRASAANKN
jgi:hypothetical protein